MPSATNEARAGVPADIAIAPKTIAPMHEDLQFSAIAVRQGQVVPLPASIWLMLSGLARLAPLIIVRRPYRPGPIPIQPLIAVQWLGRAS
jgi:hypothetical protein